MPEENENIFLRVRHYSLSQFRGDLFGGLTAGVVALPLALAFGVASGAGAIAGLYGAIALGFFAALLGGTPSQVSGPTGPMTVIAAAAVAAFPGDLQAVFTVVLIAGALQIVFGVIKAGRLRALHSLPRNLGLHERHRGDHHHAPAPPPARQRQRGLAAGRPHGAARAPSPGPTATACSWPG
ncbi:MAG: SulP family inorganic anion transporter [Desulfobacterales bacterium]|nr:SulP family inorganic anion transporter [Desulfobacterales bacterium]